MREIPKQGETYRHFRGEFYEIMTLAEDTRTGERLVIYRTLYGDDKVLARPLEDFLAPVNQIKYPNAEQEYCFEKSEPPKITQIDPAVLEFLDADTYAQKLRIFVGVEHRITDDMINTMAVALDTEVPEGSIEERAASLESVLRMQARFEVNR
ncbi:MAG: DUF1653 domain-containing protein [Lachnospiraceae bacterium]|nr:DUF1653 domain-containing protein [Lachnospiraceae bacterium]